MLTFEIIIQEGYIYEGRAHWDSTMTSRKVLSEKLDNVSDTRIKQNITTLAKHGLLTRMSKGKYLINERASNIIIEHPTKKGR